VKLDRQTYRFTDTGSFGKVALVIGILGLVLSAFGYFQDKTQLFHSYLTAFSFWLSIGLGGLFFTMLHHLVNATWSVVLRRLSESVMVTLPFMIVLFVPVALGMHELYQWSHADVVAADEILQKKTAYLNTGFFLVRAVLYFAIWSLLAWSLYKTSLAQDKEHHQSQIARMRRISAPGMILFALTSTFAAFDWLMSLDAHWYSTIFGAYIFSGGFLAVLSFLILIAIYQRKQGVLSETITVEHYHDLAKLTFAFIIFWAYMGFSQYFLIWYANIPEETVWFLHRWEGSWKAVSLVIVFGHFAFPFVVLITRAAKRSFPVLAAAAGWILLMRWVDLHWVVLPNLHHHGAHLSWLDLTTMLGIGGLFVWFFWRRYTSRAAVPVKDPSLEESIQFINR
jgi:hypothetical protein